MKQLHLAFIEGAKEKGIPEDIAEAVFDKLRAFGSYSFPKSHAAAFAVIVYQSAWLKLYHPLAFYTAILNNQPMGFWSPAVVVNDAKHHGIAVLPVDIQCSQSRCSVEGGAIRLGLEYVNGLGEASIDQILEPRSHKPFLDLADFCERTRLPRRLVENLILAGAMDRWGIERRQLLWKLARLHYAVEELDLPLPETGVQFPPLSETERLGYEHTILGMSVGEHPLTLYREWLDAHGILDSAALSGCQAGQIVRVGGLKIMHQAPPTAKGHHFLTLEDENGMVNVIIRPQIYECYRKAVRGNQLLVIEGEVQQKSGVVNVIAQRIAGLQPSREVSL